VPTYQYTCKECGEQVEVVQKFTDDPMTVCPACGGVLRKVFSPVGIVFKGSGFYRTDSRKGSSGDIPAAKDAAKDKEPSGAGAADSKSGASKDSGSSGSGSSDSSSSSGSGSGSSGSGSSGSGSGSSGSGSGSSGSSGSGSSGSSSSASSGKNGRKSSAPAASA
jgi:putative FmdB family regulatory protein